MHLVGYDLINRPVIYSCFEMITNRSIEDNRCHMISMFEQVRPARNRSPCSCLYA